MITADDINMSAWLSTAIYTLPEDPTRWVDHAISPDQKMLVRSAPLSKNVVGLPGTIEIGIVTQGDTAYVVYSGTEDSEFWAYNFSWLPAEYLGYKIHDGFFRLANEAFVVLRTHTFDKGVTRIVHCGHSAGGAVAGIMPLLLRMPQESFIVDFGTPKYMSPLKPREEIAYEYPRVRFVNQLDIVPAIPTPRYSHFGRTVYTRNGLETTSLTIGERLCGLWCYAKKCFVFRLMEEVKNKHSVTRYALGAVDHAEKRRV